MTDIDATKAGRSGSAGSSRQVGEGKQKVDERQPKKPETRKPETRPGRAERPEKAKKSH